MIAGRRLRAAIPAAVAGLLVWAAGTTAVHTQAGPAAAVSPDAVMAGLVRSSARDIVGRVSASAVQLRVLPDDAHPVILQIFSEELLARSVAVSTGAAWRMDIDARELSMETEPLTDGTHIRTIRSVLGVLLRNADGSVAISREVTGMQRDTLAGAAEAVRRELRHPDQTSWLDGVLAPVVAAAATVVIAVLLFTVRGS